VTMPETDTEDVKAQLDALVLREAEETDTTDPTVNRASDVGWLRDCKRHLVLNRLHPEARVMDIGQKRRLREGRKQEVLMRDDMRKIGRKIITPEPRNFLLPDIMLKGEIDELVEVNSQPVVEDYKSAGAFAFKVIRKCGSAEDLEKLRFPWLRHYPMQMISYMVPFHAKEAVLRFKCKDDGDWHFIHIPFRTTAYVEIDEGLRDINRMVEHEDVPAILNDGEDEVCHWCDYDEFCHPETAGERVAKHVTDLEFYLALVRRQELIDAGAKAMAKELEELEDKIKDFARATPGRISCGNFIVTMEPGNGRSYFDIPEAEKAKYKKLAPNWKPMRIKYLGDDL
jgi:protein tyrosine phosphatase (PTP) superfamily phosphohydrolase (DUF442 family)